MSIKLSKTLAALLAAALAGASLLPGCVGTPPEGALPLAPVSASPGAQLWRENCIRCHNLRLPDAYSDMEWGIVVHHMRVRAGLTGDEQRAIVAFLQNGF